MTCHYWCSAFPPELSRNWELVTFWSIYLLVGLKAHLVEHCTGSILLKYSRTRQPILPIKPQNVAQHLSVNDVTKLIIPRLAPVWSCNSVGRATDDQSRRSWVRFPIGQFFFFVSCGLPFPHLG